MGRLRAVTIVLAFFAFVSLASARSLIAQDTCASAAEAPHMTQGAIYGGWQCFHATELKFSYDWIFDTQFSLDIYFDNSRGRVHSVSVNGEEVLPPTSDSFASIDVPPSAIFAGANGPRVDFDVVIFRAPGSGDNAAITKMELYVGARGLGNSCGSAEDCPLQDTFCIGRVERGEAVCGYCSGHNGAECLDESDDRGACARDFDEDVCASKDIAYTSQRAYETCDSVCGGRGHVCGDDGGGPVGCDDDPFDDLGEVELVGICATSGTHHTCETDTVCEDKSGTRSLYRADCSDCDEDAPCMEGGGWEFEPNGRCRNGECCAGSCCDKHRGDECELDSDCPGGPSGSSLETNGDCGNSCSCEYQFLECGSSSMASVVDHKGTKYCCTCVGQGNYIWMAGYEHYENGTVMCSDGKDNDCDGRADCADSDCAAVAPCVPETPGTADGTAANGSLEGTNGTASDGAGDNISVPAASEVGTPGGGPAAGVSYSHVPAKSAVSSDLALLAATVVVLAIVIVLLLSVILVMRSHRKGQPQ